MESKLGFYVYLLMTFAAWFGDCHAVPPQQTKGLNPTGNPLVAIPIPQGSLAIDNGKQAASFTTTGPFVSGIVRNKRDTLKDQLDSKGHFGMFPSDARNADDALQKLYLLLSMTKPRTPIGLDEYDEEYDSPPIDLVLGKEPGSVRSTRKIGSQKKDFPTLNGEEPTGVPIVLYQHRMAKKSNGPTQVIPEIFLREAATSSRTQPDPRVMRKFLERIGYSFSRQSRSQNDDGRFYFMDQLVEPSLRLREGNHFVRRLVL